VSEEEDLEASKLKHSSSTRRKNNTEYDVDDFKKFYDEMNKKLLSYK
jgi:hypothetical protein